MQLHSTRRILLFLVFIKNLQASSLCVSSACDAASDVLFTQSDQPRHANNDLKCYRMGEAEEFCKTIVLEKNGTLVVEMQNLLQEWNTAQELALNNTSSENHVEQDDWRTSSMETRNRHLMETGLFSDCTFIVGEDNDTKIFRAHKVILVSASPVFESIFRDHGAQHIRVRDVTTQTFSNLLEFIYTGTLCLDNFDAACELLSVATRFRMSHVSSHCRAYLWLHLYPDNVWRGYQCAARANDSIMMEVALQITQKNTDLALRDPAFEEIPQSALVSLLEKDELGVSSELQLYDASLRWAMAEATRRGLPQDPESLRSCLGPALKLIRFLTLTPREFTDLQSNTKVLTYPESLAIIFNLNSPGAMALPETISKNNVPRNSPNLHPHFDVLTSNSSSVLCKSNTSSENIATEINTYDVFTTTIIPRSYHEGNLNIIGIQIPKRILDSCFESYQENLTIYIMSHDNKIIHTSQFKDHVGVGCFSDDISSQLMNVKFANKVNLRTEGKQIKHEFKIKIVYHKSGRFPTSLGNDAIVNANQNDQHSFIGISGHFWYFGKESFVYSMITDHRF